MRVEYSVLWNLVHRPAVLLDGTLVVTAAGREEELGPLDSVHLPKGTVRRVDNRSARPATLLVVIGTRPESS